MGCFSWFTQDKSHTRIVIGEVKKPIYMIGEINGNRVTYTENTYYKGYGVFGGKDFYEFMAQMNGKNFDDFEGDDKRKREQLRSTGIRMAFDGDPYGMSTKWKHPTLTLVEGDYHNGVSPDIDPDQGFPIY